MESPAASNLDRLLKRSLTENNPAEALSEVLQGHHVAEVREALELLEEEDRIRVLDLMEPDLVAHMVVQLPPEQAIDWAQQSPIERAVAVFKRFDDPEDAQATEQIAEILFELDEARLGVLFRALRRPVATEVFANFERNGRDRLMASLTDRETRELINNLSPDDRTLILQELPGQITQRLLNMLPRDQLNEARQLLGYEEETVGRLMTPRYVAVRPEWSIERCLEHLRKQDVSAETIDTVYVTDHKWRLMDALSLKQIVLADPSATIESLMDGKYVTLEATEDRETAVQAMQRYDLPVLPVVDSDEVLVGIVTFDDVFDVAEQEATEDFHRVGGVAPIQGNYLAVRQTELYRKRIGWLVTLVAMNVFSGAAIAQYEDLIVASAALVFFLPLLIDSGGNAGSQAATLMVRALATGQVRLRDWGKLMMKEVGVSLALGLTMSAAVFGIGVYRGGMDVAFAVSLTMICVVVVGSLIGTLLPFVLQKLNFDPASASAPLITSIADISGVIIYFSIASAILLR